MSVDLASIARDLKISPEKVEKTVQLLDDGNTIPFITRFRKDETGGLNEKQIQAIKQFVQRKRTLEERKEFILKSIESQEKLTDELRAEIDKAHTARYLEDLYLPFKPKKQSLAMVARQQGLEPLATDIFEGKSPEVDLAARAIDYVRVDKGLSSVDDVIAGVGYLIAERFSENRYLRSELRKIVWNTGQFTSKSCETKAEPSDTSHVPTKSVEAPESVDPVATPPPGKTEVVAESTSDRCFPDAVVPDAVVQDDSVQTDVAPAASIAEETGSAFSAAMPAAATTESPSPLKPASPLAEETAPTAPRPENDASAESISADATTAHEEQSQPKPQESSETIPDAPAAADPVTSAQPTQETTAATDPAPTEANAPGDANVIVEEASDPAAKNADPTEPTKKKKKKKKKKAAPDPFKDYFDFKQPLKNLPHHRVLAINRGERAGKLKVKVEVDQVQVKEKTIGILVPEDHPSKPFMEKCALEAVSKSVIPSLEREARRELTESAEKHAVEVFASNLRNLLLQPPINNRRILAIDPGFKRGCTVAAIDETGNVLETGQIFVVGNQKRREESTEKLHQLVNKHGIHTIAIGNGTACRETEQMVSDLLGSKLGDSKVNYIILNEAGATTYSTSEIGREELPDLSPNERSAVSIGRRLLDPLSELVKISPANIGVGMYQHDVKAKHLSESLDEVVQFCVNRVGVNVNTASPSLLRYVSGLNQLTARRIFEYRNEKGVFKNRAQLKEVTGLGDATFVQAAGFIRVPDGDEPLDATPIHPESYGVARKILEKINAHAEQLFQQPVTAHPAPVAESKPAEAAEAQQASLEHVAADGTSDNRATDEYQLATCQQTMWQRLKSQLAKQLKPRELLTCKLPLTPWSHRQHRRRCLILRALLPPSRPVIRARNNQFAKRLVRAVAGAAKASERPRRDPERAALLAKLKELNIEELSREFSVGNLLVRDIIKTFSQPHRDPRDGVSKPIFRSGIIKAEDLKVDMQLDAQVVNVVDFGVFVDIGLGESSLIHVSQLSNRFIRNPHQFFSIGDVVKVWVTEIDGPRRRVKLTAIKPGTPKFEPSKSHSRRGRKPEQARAERGKSNRGKFKGSSGQRGKPAHARPSQASRRPPKPVKPITEKMLEGKEPMRSFSDLLQFVEKKPSATAKKKDES